MVKACLARLNSDLLAIVPLEILISEIVLRRPSVRRRSTPMDAAYPYGPPAFRRILLKLSGESFCRPGEGGISVDEVSRIARQASRVPSRGVQLAIVVGGGNILRGATFARNTDVIQEATAHYMGMTATVINGLALQDALEGTSAARPG